MTNRDFGIWFLPILAALAFYYPSASGKQAAPPSNEISSAAQPSSAPTIPPEASNDSAQRLIRAYTGARSDSAVPGMADFIIATVPDPLDSSLSHLFDRHIGAIQRAMEAADYVLDRFELPWLQIDEGKEKNPFDRMSIRMTTVKDQLLLSTPKTDLQSIRLHQREPGVLLFRSTKEPGKLFIIFLVGESPTAGIHKDAFKVALRQGETLCEAQQNKAICHKQFKFLAPTFSGSADSLINAFKTWEQNRSVSIISGSATGIERAQFEERLDEETSIKAHFKPNLVLDSDAFRAFDNFLTRKAIARRQVAVLTESNTGFGGALRSALKKATAKHNQEDTAEILSLTYPLHISQLRSESEKIRAATKNGSGETLRVRPENLRLSLEDAAKAKDRVTNFSSFEKFSTELVLSSLLAAISREGIRYVGLFSTDIRDQIFLAREIRKHAPNAVLFTFGADLLYLHSDVNLDFQGMLLFSTYPLFSMNQHWTRSLDSSRSRLQFPDHTSQGVYNATLDLIGSTDKQLETRSPFNKNPVGPVLWLSAVGTNDLWPIEVFPDDQKNKQNDEKNEQNNNDRSAIAEAAGIYSRPFVFTCALVLVLCLLVSSCLITTIPWKNGGNLLITRRLRRPLSWFLRICGDAVFRQHREDRQPFLFCLSVCILIFSFVLLSVFGRFVSLAATPLYLWYFWLMLTVFTTLAALSATVVIGKTLFAIKQYRLRKACENFYGLLCALMTFTGMALGCASGFYLHTATLRSPGGVVLLVPLAVLLVILCKIRKASQILFSVLGGTIGILFSRFIESPRIAFLFSLMALLLDLLLLFIATRLKAKRNRQAGAPPLTWRDDNLPRDFRKALSHFTVSSIPVVIFCSAFAQAVDIAAMEETLKLFYHLRTVNVGSGLSPLLPLFFIGAAATLWTICSVRRLRMLEELIGPKKNAAPRLLYFDAESMPTLRILESKITDLLTYKFLALPGSPVILTFVGVPCSILFLYRLVPSIEGQFFYLFFGLSFLIVYVALSFTFFRFLSVWWRTRNLLRYLSSHPACAIYSEIAKNGEMPRMDLSQAFTPYAALRFSCQLANDFVRFGEANDARRFLEAASKAGEEGDWQSALKSRHKAHRSLSQAALEIEGTLKTSHSYTKEWAQKGQRFLAAQTVVFLHHVFVHLQNLIFFVVAGLILMLLAINYYPFQPREWLLWFNWVVILATVLLTIVVFVQMGRDRVLSLLSNTPPGQVTWTREFFFRILLYVVMPVLTLLGAQFPESLSRILSWVGTFQSS